MTIRPCRTVVRNAASLARRAALCAALCTVASPVAADPFVDRIGVGAAFASPNPGVSLYARHDERWSGTLTVGLGTDLRLNYARERAPDRYWTFGAGHVADMVLVRAGYGRTWRRGPWRWHLETTLNLPVYIDAEDGLAGIGSIYFAGLALFIPIGFGVHYVFGGPGTPVPPSDAPTFHLAGS